MPSRDRPRPRLPSFALVLSYLGFVSLGLPDTVLGAAWPAIRLDLQLPLSTAGSALLLTTTGIVLSSAASGWVAARFGTGAVLIGSTLLASAALGLGAVAPTWTVFLVAAFVAGLGGGAVDASLNHMVARRHSARHLNWLHACWGVGASLTPILVASLLKAGFSWRRPYAILACVELALAVAFLASRRVWSGSDEAAAPTTSSAPGTTDRGAMVAGVVMFTFYGGVEAGTGLWATSLLTLTRGASPARAGGMIAIYWGALTVGRFVLGAAVDRLGAMRLLRSCVWGALVALAALALPGTPLWFCGVALACLGFFLAPVYPVAMHDTASRFEQAGRRLVGYQVAACSVGVALLPAFVGLVGTWTSPLAIPVVLLGLAVCVVALEALRRREA